jgi:hypothetical protein
MNIPQTVDCYLIDVTGIELDQVISFINLDTGNTLNPIIFGGNIPQEYSGLKNALYPSITSEVPEDETTNKFNEFIRDMVPVKDEKKFTYDMRETKTDVKETNALKWHREFHFPDTVFNKTWDYDWICLAYVTIDNCAKNCGTHIMYYNKEDRCRMIELQIKPMQFILFQDSKFLHKLPHNQEYTSIDKQITRKIHRIYIRTTQNHQVCDTRFKFHTKDIDHTEALPKSIELPKQQIHNIKFETVYSKFPLHERMSEQVKQELFRTMNKNDVEQHRGGKKNKTHKKRNYKKRKTQHKYSYRKFTDLLYKIVVKGMGSRRGGS